jgi:Family of unknown function (DUF5317)
MFILYAVAIGLLVGLLTGGRLERLGEIRFHLGWLALLAFVVQLVLFSPTAAALAPDAGRAIYVVSTAAVLVVVVANVRLAGVPLVIVGALSNLAAIVANGGSMPADPGALAAVGQDVDGTTNSVVLAHPALQPLTDIFAMPAWLPLANIFSIGDVLIALGIAVAIASALRSGSDERRPGVRRDAGPG